MRQNLLARYEINKKVVAGIGLIAGALGLYLWTKKAKPCAEGATKCVDADLYACINGKWELQELNSPACILPASCSVDADCPLGYVCENGVCVPQPVKLWEFYGVVTDAQTQAVIPLVTVSMNGISSTGDSEGKYTISGIVDTDHIVVTFSAEGYASREYGVGWSGKPYELNASLVLKEIAQATLYGTVTDDKGKPVEGATLSLYWDGETHPEYSAGISSSYSVSAVSPGVWHITVEKQGYETWDKMVTIIGGEPNELNIVLTQIWDWEGIYQPSDYISKWEEMVAAQGIEAVIEEIYQIPGIPPHEKVSIYDSSKFPFVEVLDNHLPEYIVGRARCGTHHILLFSPPVGYDMRYKKTVLGYPLCYDSLIEVRCNQLPGCFWAFVPTRDPEEKHDACVFNDECYSVPSIGGLDCWMRANNVLDYTALRYVAVYAECKRHGSVALSFYQFWEYLKVKAYGPGCPGSHCQVAGYIFYDRYGSGIGWDVDYRTNRWVYSYKSGELLHYV